MQIKQDNSYIDIDVYFILFFGRLLMLFRRFCNEPMYLPFRFVLSQQRIFSIRFMHKNVNKRRHHTNTHACKHTPTNMLVVHADQNVFGSRKQTMKCVKQLGQSWQTGFLLQLILNLSVYIDIHILNKKKEERNGHNTVSVRVSEMKANDQEQTYTLAFYPLMSKLFITCIFALEKARYLPARE